MNKRKLQNRECKKIKDKKYLLNNQNAITLIALVISIIVMLILAGVSLNATIGEDGILTQAKNTTYIQSCAVLEEWLGQLYVQNYENLDNSQDKILGIINLGADWIYQPSKYGYGSLNYIVDSDGKALYLIQKDNLPDEIKNQVKGGDLNGKSKEYSNYLKLEDVYGVTSNLEVYYCSNGKDSILGIDKDKIDEDLPSRIVIDNIDNGIGNILASYDKNGDSKLSSQEVAGIKEITINSTTGISSLSDLYNLYGLQKLIIEDVSLSDLNGIENCSQLYYIFIKRSTIGDYSAIGKLGSKLQQLYFLQTTNDEVFKFGKQLSNYDLPNLNYLGFFATYNASVDFSFGTPTNRYSSSDYKIITNLSDISPLANLTVATKNAVKYLYINDNQITSLEALSGFSNLYYLRASFNQITSLKGLENKPNLTYLQASYNKLDDTSDVKGNEDVLSAIEGNQTLYWLDLRGNKIKWISHLKECSNLKYIYLDDIETIDDEDMSEIKENIKNAKNVIYSPKYSLSLTSNDTTKLSLASQNITESQFKSLKNCTNLTYLSLYNTKFVKDTGEALTEAELNSLLNEILPKFTKLTELSLYNVKFSDMSFVTSLSKLVMLDLRGTSATTDGDKGLTLLENNTNLGILAVDNSKIDLSKIQNIVERVAKSNAGTGIEGDTSHIFKSHCSSLICNNPTVLKTLEKCTNISKLTFGMQNYTYYNNTLNLDLTNCSKLTEVSLGYITFGTLKLPNSVSTINSSQNNTMFEFKTDSELADAYFRSNGNIQNILVELSSKCKKLKTLEIFNNTSVIDFGILTGCTSLNTLKITGAQWTGKVNYSKINTLNDLKDLQSLKKIDIHWTTIDTLECVKELTQLTALSAYNTNVSDISQISNLTNLTSVYMANNAITDVENIGSLINVSSLSLNGNYISNGLQVFSKLQNLETLNLSDNSITDTSTYYDASGKMIRYNVLDVLVGLNKNYKLKNLYISGNNGIIDKSILTQSGTSWTNLKK